MTLSERKLWSRIRGKQLGFLFRRQYPIGDFVLDFYCPEVKLCIEVDGPHHADRVQQDGARDEYLETKGILTIRIPSRDLFDHEYPILDKWLTLIERTCRERKAASKAPGTPPPDPLSRDKSERRRENKWRGVSDPSPSPAQTSGQGKG